MLGGLGITLIVGALILGVADPNAPSNVIGLVVLTGFLCLGSAIAAWIGVVQPHKHFDDINVPLYHGHEAHHAGHADEHPAEDAPAATPAQH